MTDVLTNDEINRLVADIEGWTIDASDVRMPLWIDPDGFADTCLPPFATDWAWCGPLVEKYKITIGALTGDRWVATCGDTLFGNPEADTPQRAICLAVIAAAGKNRVEK